MFVNFCFIYNDYIRRSALRQLGIAHVGRVAGAQLSVQHGFAYGRPELSDGHYFEIAQRAYGAHRAPNAVLTNQHKLGDTGSQL